ncbi:MAG: acetolactate synthase small subunit [Deltaproteobacteria bacterium]|nr:acetolactate synthase small subunit [Deltaproteobacteria bacterium]
MSVREHTLSILVRNEPGVLSKIAGMFYRRGHNIETLTVGKTHQPGLSKIVISVPTDDRTIEHLRRQIENLVDVEKATLVERNQSILMEVCLLRVAYKNPSERMEIMASAQPYRPQLVGIDDHSLTLQIAERPILVDDFVSTMRRHEVLDVSRTGMTAIGPPMSISIQVHGDEPVAAESLATPWQGDDR